MELNDISLFTKQYEELLQLIDKYFNTVINSRKDNKHAFNTFLNWTIENGAVKITYKNHFCGGPFYDIVSFETLLNLK